MNWLREERAKAQPDRDFFAFDFSGENNSRSSMVHVNAMEFPFAVFAVDYLKKDRLSRRRS